MSAEPARPSARAVERLATGVGSDVADLRTQLHRALEQADRLEADGRQDLAVAVLQDQRDALLEVHQRLEARLAGAAVEREAERVVSAVAPERERGGNRQAPAVPAAQAASDDGMVLRLLASAAAAVVGFALLLAPGPGAGSVTTAGSSATGDAPTADGSRDAGDTTNAAETPPSVVTDRGTSDGASDRIDAPDLRALAIPEAHVRATQSDEEDPEGDADRGARLVPLPPADTVLEALTPDEASLTDGEGAADPGDGEQGEGAADPGDGEPDDTTGPDGGDSGGETSLLER